ncbi:unnamed protein product [Rotaria sp. Silwood2]|nr:unnamed protein product [Rotaria sp. Silwood2]CAF4462614.1 unnamed protein product [Rotaria sp. Silwood2]
MKLWFIILSIYFYIISQATIDGRTTQLRKAYWFYPNNGYNPGDLFHQNFERKRQAGWGRRRYLTAEDDHDDILLRRIYGPHDDSAYNWFNDK